MITIYISLNYGADHTEIAPAILNQLSNKAYDKFYLNTDPYMTIQRFPYILSFDKFEYKKFSYLRITKCSGSISLLLEPNYENNSIDRTALILLTGLLASKIKQDFPTKIYGIQITGL